MEMASRKFPASDLKVAHPLLAFTTEESPPQVREGEDPASNVATWPAPTPLRTRTISSKVLEALFDIFLCGLASLFVVIGILAQKANGLPVDAVAYAAKLMSAARLVSITECHVEQLILLLDCPNLELILKGPYCISNSICCD